MIEVVYKNRDNPNTITFKEDGVEIDFSAATRMVCSFRGSAVVADSDVTAALFDWSQGSGVVEFNFNDLSIDAGTYQATLIVYDPTHTDGQVVAHPEGAELSFKFAL